MLGENWLAKASAKGPGCLPTFRLKSTPDHSKSEKKVPKLGVGNASNAYLFPGKVDLKLWVGQI